MDKSSLKWTRAHLGCLIGTATLVTACGGGDGSVPAASTPFPLHATASKCASVVGAVYGPATVKSAALVAASSTMPEHCRVVAFKTGRPIFQMVALLPTDWGGGMVHGGGGGFDGFLPESPFWNATHPLQQGMVWIASNGGHDDYSGAKLGDPEALRDYSYAAIGPTFEFGNAMMQGYYSNSPAQRYFVGCSKGGQEAMAAAAYYPQNYDGIIAQAPAFNASGYVTRIASLGPLPPVNSERWALLNKTRIDRCDAADGLVDGVVSNPAACNPDPLTLADWSADERKTIGAIMSDLKLSDGTVVEGRRGYGPYLGDFTAYGLQWMRNVIVRDEPNYDGSSFAIDRYWPKIKAAISGVSMDIEPILLGNYLKQGKKLLVYMGDEDTALSVKETKEYQARVVAAAGASATNTQIRFFPGVGHCGATDSTALLGPDKAEMIGDLRKWVEKGIAPTDLTATRVSTTGTVEKTRPICLSGSYARYKGTGDATKAENFLCVPEGT